MKAEKSQMKQDRRQCRHNQIHRSQKRLSRMRIGFVSNAIYIDAL
jgi:hypothetical protein